MFLEIRELEQKPIRFEQSLAVGVIPFDSEFEQQSPLIASGTAELHTSTEELRVQGRVQVSLRMECDRCTEPFVQGIDEEFDLIYVPAPVTSPGAEIAIGPSDANVGFYDGPGLELNDILQEGYCSRCRSKGYVAPSAGVSARPVDRIGMKRSVNVRNRKATNVGLP